MRIFSLIVAAGLAVSPLLPRAGVAQTQLAQTQPAQTQLAQTQLAQAAPQQGPGWFIPGQHPAAVPVPARPAPAPAPAPLQAAASAAPPAIPQLPALPKAPSPPAAVMGVLSVPDVYRQSNAVQAVQKVINARREALNQDAIKEQAVWRQMQEALAHDRPKLSPEQIRAREAALQDRITNAQKTFSGRNQQIQEAAQVAIGEVNRMLIAVIRQVAESHGMNLVLHREQVALNMNAFDITDEVAKNLNLRLPSVTVPPDGAMPVGAMPDGAMPVGAMPVGAMPVGAMPVGAGHGAVAGGAAPLPLPPAPAGGASKP